MPDPLDIRLSRLEMVLGLDPNSACQGSPELCEGLCTLEVCPSTQNALYRLLDSLGTMHEQVSVIHTMVGQLAVQSGITDLHTFHTRAELITELQQLRGDRQRMARDIEKLDQLSASSILITRARETLGEVEEKIRGVQVALEMLG